MLLWWFNSSLQWGCLRHDTQMAQWWQFEQLGLLVTYFAGCFSYIIYRYRIQRGRSGLWLPLVWVAQKPRGGSPGPRLAGAYIGDGCCQWPHGRPVGWDGLLWLDSCLWGSMDPVDSKLNLAVVLFFRRWVIAWLEWHVPISDQYTWAGVVALFAIPATNF